MKNKLILGLLISIISLLSINSFSKTEDELFNSWENLKSAEKEMNQKLPVSTGENSSLVKIIVNRKDKAISYYIAFKDNDLNLGFLSFNEYMFKSDEARKMIVNQVCTTGAKKILYPPLSGVVRYVYLNEDGDYLENVIITKNDCNVIKEI